MGNSQQSLCIEPAHEMNESMDDEGIAEGAEVDNPHSPQGVDECGMYGITRCSPSVDVSLERLGICPRQDADYPNYSTLESRMESYSSWPLHIKLRPEALSEAGLFYTGTGDQTICFQCGGGLKDWEENDDPWHEHAMYFSKCTYLIQKKGRDFINEVLNKKPTQVATASLGALQSEFATPTTSSFEEHALGAECVSDLGSSGYSSGSSCPEESSGSSSSQGLESQLPKAPKPEAKTLDDQRACKICYAEEVGVVFLPCGHLVSCVNCAPSLKTCAVCRKPFSATVRAYLS